MSASTAFDMRDLHYKSARVSRLRCVTYELHVGQKVQMAVSVQRNVQLFQNLLSFSWSSANEGLITLLQYPVAH